MSVGDNHVTARARFWLAYGTVRLFRPRLSSLERDQLTAALELIREGRTADAIDTIRPLFKTVRCMAVLTLVGMTVLAVVLVASHAAIDGQRYLLRGQESDARGDFQNAIWNYNWAARSGDLSDSEYAGLLVLRGRTYVGWAEERCRSGNTYRVVRRFENAAENFTEALEFGASGEAEELLTHVEKRISQVQKFGCRAAN